MAKERKYKIIIAAGGTGGHIFPAIALAKKFTSHGHKVFIAGTGNELEKKIFSDHDIEIKYFKSTIKDFSSIKKFFLSFRKNKEIRSYIEKNDPDLILGMGGYASSEFCLSAERKACIIIHEQNSIAGRANRFLVINRRAKAAIEGLTQSLARAYGKHQIRVNCIIPGQVWTPRQIRDILTPEYEQFMNEKQCIPGRILPEDVAQLALFLGSDAGRMCTRRNYFIDAGIGA